MERKAKFALIGCGRIAENHLDAIENAPHAELVAVCDILEETANTTRRTTAIYILLRTWHLPFWITENP